jgi:hypothetical protein
LFRKAAGILLACGLALNLAQAQSGRASLELGIGVAGPGEHATVPVILSASDPGGVGKIFFELSFPNKLLTFSSFTKGADTESLEITILTKLLESEEENILQVELSSSDPIPEGTLLELLFDVAPEAEPNDEYPLKNLAQRIETTQGEALEATGLEGFIIVVGDAVFGCFFYMH